MVGSPIFLLAQSQMTIEFTEENVKVDIDALAARYKDPDFWRKSVEGYSDA